MLNLTKIRAHAGFRRSQLLVNSTRSYCDGQRQLPKRFYKEVTVEQGKIETDKDAYCILLDGRKVKTPGGLPLALPNEKLAMAVAYEWDCQKEFIKPHIMHMTSLSFTAIEKTEQRLERIKEIIGFIGSDTVCFRVSDKEKLLELQTEKWDPLIEWFKKEKDVEIYTTTGLDLKTHPQKTFNIAKKIVTDLDHWTFTGFEQAVAITHSFIIPYASLQRHISTAEALDLSQLEAEFQRSQWGRCEDEDVLWTEGKRAGLSSAILFARWNHDAFINSAAKI